jgi:hypothetical protein
VGETFFQLLEVQQNGAYTTQGLTLASSVRYRVLSRFTVKKRLDDGKLLIEQHIDEVRLLGASPLAAGPVGAALKDMLGRTFKVTLSPTGDVLGFQGQAGKPNFLPLQLDVGTGMQLVSLLDEDGWKELLRATFFQPDVSLFQGKTIERKMAHSWGPLGHWVGKVVYAPAVPGTTEELKNTYRIAYLYQMLYAPPGAAAGKSPLPILQAAFQPQAAGGQLFFDRDKGKIVLAQEQFRVTGALTVRLAGQPVTIAVEEMQTFRVLVFDRRDGATGPNLPPDRGGAQP